MHRQPVHAVSSSPLALTSEADEARVIRENVMRGLDDVAAGRVLSGEVVEAAGEHLTAHKNYRVIYLIEEAHVEVLAVHHVKRQAVLMA